MNDITEKNKCTICGAEIDVDKSICRKCKLSQSKIQKYGSLENARLSALEKRRQTNVERYGVENPARLKSIKEKTKQSIIEKYGSQQAKEAAALEKRKQTCFERFGVENTYQIDKAKKSIQEKYGVDHIWQSEEVKEKIKQAHIKNLGVDHPSKSQKVIDLRKENMIKNYGVDCSFKLDSVKKTIKNRYRVDFIFQSKEIQNKCKHSIKEKYGVGNVSQNPEIHKKQIASIREAWKNKSEEYMKNYKKACSESVRNHWQNMDSNQRSTIQRNAAIKRSNFKKHLDGFDSSWERTLYDFWTDIGLTIERQVPVEYIINGTKKTSLIDFKVDDFLIEVKGPHLLANIHNNMSPEKLQMYRDNNVIIITKEQKFNHAHVPYDFVEKCDSLIRNNLITLIDYECFDMECLFPVHNMPVSYYKTIVNRTRSQWDAFYDLKIRWDMIKNRIKYEQSGWITTRSIRNALTLTKVSKQPSKFGKKECKDIIQKYITTNLIYDPFSGWGERHDVATEIGIDYFGIDANENLVNEHKTEKRNIIFADAEDYDFKSDQPFSIFTCPPYKDKELYFENMKIKSESEWIYMIIKKYKGIAKEMIFVAKDIDDSLKQYIVEEINHKQQFGSAHGKDGISQGKKLYTEYILRIT